MDMLRQPRPILQRQLALVVGKLFHSSSAYRLLHQRGKRTIEFVNVAGTATAIHHTIPHKNSLPFPLTSALTSLPSSSATYRLINVRITRNTVCEISNRISLLLTPGITTFNSRNRFRKNSRLSSTFRCCPTKSGELVRDGDASCCR